ncbi:MAG: O-antigen ligase family protein [Vicinamibacterales bacterium]
MRAAQQPARLTTVPAGMPASSTRRPLAQPRIGTSEVVIAGAAAVTLALAVLTGDLGILASATAMWLFALRFGWAHRRALPMFLWLGFTFFYPHVAQAYTSLQEKATIEGALAWAIGLVSFSGAVPALARSRWLVFSLGLWLLWGLMAYVPVLLTWLNVLPPSDPFALTYSALKTAVPILGAGGVALAAGAAIREPADLERLGRAVLVGTGLVAVAALVQAMMGADWINSNYESQAGRLHGVSVPDANGYARLLLMPSLLLMALAIAGRHAAWRRGLWLVLVLAVISIALTLSRTTYLSFAAGIVVLLLLNLRASRTALVGLILAAVLFGAAYGLGIADRFGQGAERRSVANLEGRIALYAVLVDIVRENPWFGVRPGGYFEALDEINLQSETQVSRGGAHNMVLAIASEWGLPMAFALLAALAGTIWTSFDALRRLRLARAAPAAPLLRAVLTALVAVAVAYLVHGLTENVPYDHVFVLLGLAAAIRFAVVPALPAQVPTYAQRGRVLWR